MPADPPEEKKDATVTPAGVSAKAEIGHVTVKLTAFTQIPGLTRAENEAFYRRMQAAPRISVSGYQGVIIESENGSEHVTIGLYKDDPSNIVAQLELKGQDLERVVQRLSLLVNHRLHPRQDD